MQRFVIGPSQSRPLHLDVDDRMLYKSGGGVIPLTPKALDILFVLVQSAGQIVSRDTLRQRVWADAFVEEANITKNISVLRSNLREHLDGAETIETLSKRGYRFIAPVSFESSPQPLSISIPGPAQTLPHQPRRIALSAVALVLISIALGIVFEHLRARPASRVEATVRPSLAVLEFKNLSDQTAQDWLGTALVETLGSDLARSNGVRLISGERAAQAERDLALAPMRSYDDATVQTVGRRLHCDFALIGFYLPVGNQVRLDLQLRNTTTGGVVADFSQTAPADKLFQVISEADAGFRHNLGLPALPPSNSTALPSIDDPKDGLRDYAEGVRLFRAGKPAEAQKLLSSAVLASPLSPLPHAALASAWRSLGFDDRAATEAHTALEHAAGLPNEQRLVLQGGAYLVLQDWPSAIEAFTKLRNLYPDNYDYTIGLAHAQCEAGRCNLALDLLRDLTTHSAQAANDLRVLHFETGTTGGIADYRNMLFYAGQELRLARTQSSPFYESDALSYEGYAWGQLGDNNRALSDYREAETISTAIGDDLGLATVLRYIGDIQVANLDPAAVLTLRRALAIQQKIGNHVAIVDTSIGLGNAYLNLQDPEAAQASFQFALDSSIENHALDRQAVVDNSLAFTAGSLGQPQKEIDYANRALALARRLQAPSIAAYALNHRGTAATILGDLSAARLDFQQALQNAQSNGETFLLADTLENIASLELQAGNVVAARQAIDRANAMHLEDSSDLADRHLIEAAIQIEEGRPSLVDGTLNAIAKDTPAAPAADAWRLLANAALLRGDLSSAQTDIDKSLHLASTSSNIGAHLLPASLLDARIHAAAGHPGEALAKLPQILLKAHRISNLSLQLEIRLDQGRFLRQLEGGNQANSTRILQAVESEATHHGYGLLAMKAHQSLTLRPPHS